MTHYETLEVEPHASQRDIKRAYRRLAKRYHPDLNPGDPEAEERFKDVVAAYEVLSDRDERAAYDASLREPVRTSRSVGSRAWERPTRTSQEWRDLERDLRRWRRPSVFDARDAELGALLSVSVTLASNASRQTWPFLVTLIAAVVAGLAAVVPFRLAQRVTSPRVRAVAAVAAPFAAAFGAILGAGIVTGAPPPSIWGGSGIPFAFIGGIGGALIGGMFGRSFHATGEPAVCGIVGGITGALVGAGLGGAMWYWSAVFRWMERPVREDLSLLASVGVVAAFLGAAVAAARGGLRERAGP